MSEVATPPAWIADLPEDLRGNATLTSFKGNEWKDVGPVLAKSYVESRAMIGKKAYDLPQDDWKPEQWQSWNKTIGVPDAPDKYGAPADEMLTKAGLNKEVLGAAQKRFHELGLTPRQVNGIMDEWYIPISIAGSEARAKAQEDELKSSGAKLDSELSQIYGDKKDAKVGLVKAVLNKFGSPELVEWADKSGAGNDPGFVKAFIKIGEAMIEDSSRGGGSGLGPESLKAEALKKLEEIKAARIADPTLEAKYNDPKSAERSQWNDLLQKAYAK